MWISKITTFFLIFTVTSSDVLLYNTENKPVVEKFDCVYYTYEVGDEIAYCRRPGVSQLLDRNRTECDNQGELRRFRDLLDENIHPSDVLKWSSSVEIADKYAKVFYNRSSMDDGFVCNCTKAGTFGKYCEYQWTHEAKSFTQTIEIQFREKQSIDSWNTQRYGQIICYETLSCYSGDLCLDWREISDGFTRCLNGIDEDNWDKLEFNECEDDEFRCTNGMCIAEEFWLDGDFDCMDWSDEYFQSHGEGCPFKPSSIECDEHFCRSGMYSCSDGQCINWHTRLAFQRYGPAEDDCFTKRNLNYMCEAGPHRSTWTLDNGLCWPDRNYDDHRYPLWNMIERSNLTIEEICQYLFRCFLSDGFEFDCPCNRLNCTSMLTERCPREDGLILYPPEGLINSNVLFFYNYSKSIENPNFEIFALNKTQRCRGFAFEPYQPYIVPFQYGILTTARSNHMLCTVNDSNLGYRNFHSPFRYDQFCWNNSLTFTGRPYAVQLDMCHSAGECISQYRIYDRSYDCLKGEDELEIIQTNFCTGNVGRQRFQCYNEDNLCLPVILLGSRTTECSNSYDEMWYGTDAPVQIQLPCSKDYTESCLFVKEYVRQSSIRNWTLNSSLIEESMPTKWTVFRSYCDSWWNLGNHIDEIPSSCQYWICQNHRDQYQCRSGQCIDLEWVCDGEWDCVDASDEEGILLIDQWSQHNARLPDLERCRQRCQEYYSKGPFSTICNTSFEFGCYRSKVNNPLDIKTNRPCINLTQIGDGIEDCYNAYDEKNTFTANAGSGDMWGFHFRCGTNHQSYTNACNSNPNLNCTDMFCSIYRDKDRSCSNIYDFICLDDDSCMKNGRCNEIKDCFHGEDEYWCPSGSIQNQIEYRSDKRKLFLHHSDYILPPWYPSEQIEEINEETKNITVDNNSTSYRCNRGVAILEMNETKCLCPPAYYGRWCEFFTDRISFIVQIDRKTMPTMISNVTLQILANLYFQNSIIDYHKFTIVPYIETYQIIKHKFYLVYSRTDAMLIHKRERFRNRTDIISNHPYSVHFDLFSFENNSTITELGSWHYPIYFDFLPAFRLALLLKFPDWFANTTNKICFEHHCNKNSTCLPIFNRNDSYYCSCKTGYYGIDCSQYEQRCETECSSDALCSVQQTNLYCLCPLNRFGPSCHLNFDACDSNPCLNNGTCHLKYGLSEETSYLCICSNRFYGTRCEYSKASVRVKLNMTTTLSIRATVVQLHNIGTYFRLINQYQQVHNGLPSMIRYDHSGTHAPTLGLLKIYDDSQHVHYFILYILNQMNIDIRSSPQYCPRVLSLFSQDVDRSIPDIFYYHQICRNDTKLLCFYDKNYLCLCQEDHYRADCLSYDSQFDQCDRCLARGRCLQGDRKDSNDFICLCPSCYEGYRCEFSLQPFGFTLDSLMINYSKQTKYIYVSVVSLLFLIGFFNNLCSFVTFERPKPRQFRVGNYLFTVACLNQIVLFCLLTKFIQVTMNMNHIGMCKGISYILSVFTRSTYWLTSWVTIDRLLIIRFPMSMTLRNAHLAIQINILTLIVLLIMHTHEIFGYTLIQYRDGHSSTCVTNFSHSLILIYNRISTLIHYLLPFIIQVFSVTFLIVMAARSRVRTLNKTITFGQVLKNQFQTKGELYIAPIIIILSALPQTVFTFSLACNQLTDWQRHTLLGTYLLSYVPQILGFILYVIPSTAYKKEFAETILAKKIFSW